MILKIIVLPNRAGITENVFQIHQLVDIVVNASLGSQMPHVTRTWMSVEILVHARMGVPAAICMEVTGKYYRQTLIKDLSPDD